MSTSVRVNTYTHSITFLTDKLLLSLKQVIAGIGLDTSKFMNSWVTTQLAISTWLKSGHLQSITVEIYKCDKGR